MREFGHPAMGLSPHGRGKHGQIWVGHSIFWSIPARAGETFASKVSSLPNGVYPRTGGGNAI